MIKKMECYIAVCDLCGCELEFDGCGILHDTEKLAREAALENGWKEIEPGKWACDNCVEELVPEDNN